MAGISTDYYLRLEQGRDRTPSTRVLDALAGVLRMDHDQIAYLHALTRPRSRHGTRPPSEDVPDGTLRLLGALPMPAFVQDRYLNVLAANRMAEVLSPTMRPGANRLVAAFLDPHEAELHEEWERLTAAAVGQLRATVGAEPDDPCLMSLVGALCTRSERFRTLWARQDVVGPRGGPARLRHPEVGCLELYREKLVVAGTGGQTLVIYHAEPGSESARALALLGSLAADGSGAVPEAASASTRRRRDRPPRLIGSGRPQPHGSAGLSRA